MAGFTLRDYVVGAFIITGVLLAWFMLMAAFLGITKWQITMPLAIVTGCVVYVFVQRNKNKPPKPKN
jgi:membrane protein implicated in regulation of membrane protease activity